MRKISKSICSALAIICCVIFITGTNLYAAEQWWSASIDTVIVKTSPSLQYTVKVTNPAGPWTMWLNFTNKEILATALTALSVNPSVTLKFENTTNELLQINLDQ